MTFEVQSFPSSSRTELFDLVVSSYFTSEELREASQQIEQGASYAEVLSVLVERGQNELRTLPCCLTIPGGKVLAHPPDRAVGDLSYIPFQLMEIARAALPPPPEEEGAVSQGPLTLWGQHVPSPQGKGAQAGASTKKPSSPGRVSFEIAQLGRSKADAGWVALARGETLGLGYQVHPLLSGNDGFWVDLLHLRSGVTVCSIMLHMKHLDHDRIREWVLACLQIADWTQGYQTLLRQQPTQQGTLKRQLLARSLEAIWQGQEQQIRQGTLFDEV